MQSIWTGSGRGCGMAVMDTVVYFLGFFLFYSFSRGVAILILLYLWVSATGLVCTWISL